MPEDKYEQLKKVIQTAVPEIMELKFGCEIGDGEFNFIIYRETKKNFWVKETNARGSIYQFPKPLKISIILGRPIRLADVLLTMKLSENSPSPMTWNTYHYDVLLDSIRIIEWQNTKTEPSIVDESICKWNLSNDNLDNQSDETKMFLYNLLMK